MPQSKSPEQGSRAGRGPASHSGCSLCAARWGTLGRKLAEPQDPGGHGRGAGAGPGGPAAEKASAGAGEESGRLGTGTGRNRHRTHGPARGDAMVRGVPGEWRLEGLEAETAGSEGGGAWGPGLLGPE